MKKEVVEALINAHKFDDAITEAKEIEVESAKSWALCTLCGEVVRVRKEGRKETNRLFTEIEKMVKDLKNKEDRSLAIDCLGEALVKVGNYSHALDLAVEFQIMESQSWPSVAASLQKQKL